eukprot:contig_3504_g751
MANVAPADGFVVPRSFTPNLSLSELTGVQRGIVIAVRGLEADCTATTTADEVKGVVAETLTPGDLFQAKLTQLPTFYKDFRT